MATIEDMADEFLKTEKKALKFVKRASFVAGAYAVLKKVECHLNRICVDNHSDDDLEDLYDTLCEMVKNLKGE